MSPEIFIPFIVVMALLFGGLIYLGIWMEKKKRAAFRELAARLGLTYNPEKNRPLAQRYAFLAGLNTGSNRYASHVLTGSMDGEAVLAFEHHYETHSTDSKGNRSTHHHYHSVFVVKLTQSFPKVTIFPEGILSKIAQAFGYDDIDFESAEFSRAYCVRSPDKRFAYDICHPLAIEFLLKHRGMGLQIEGATLAAINEGALSSTEVEFRLHRLLAFRQLVPEYLLKTDA